MKTAKTLTALLMKKFVLVLGVSFILAMGSVANAAITYNTGTAVDVTTTLSSGTNPGFLIEDSGGGAPTHVTITGPNGQFKGTNKRRILVTGSSTLTVDPGGPGGRRTDFGHETLLTLQDSASALINGGMYLYTGNTTKSAYGFALNDSSSVTLGNTANIDLLERGVAGDVRLATINGGTLNIEGGVFSAAENKNGNLIPFIVGNGTGTADAALNISGGSFTFGGTVSDSIIGSDGAVTLFSDLAGIEVNGAWITSTTTFTTAGSYLIEDGLLLNGGEASELRTFDLSAGGTLAIEMPSAAIPAIPEPSTLLIWSLGLLGLAWYTGRRRSRQ